MAVQSPLEDLKIVSPISAFVLNILTLKESAFFGEILTLVGNPEGILGELGFLRWPHN